MKIGQTFLFWNRLILSSTGRVRTPRYASINRQRKEIVAKAIIVVVCMPLVRMTPEWSTITGTRYVDSPWTSPWSNPWLLIIYAMPWSTMERPTAYCCSSWIVSCMNPWSTPRLTTVCVTVHPTDWSMHGGCHSFIMEHTTACLMVRIKVRPWLSPLHAPWDAPYLYLPVGCTMEYTMGNTMGFSMPWDTPWSTPCKIMVYAVISSHFPWCAEWSWGVP